MTSSYVDLHSHSFYSFGEGASHIHELLERTLELERHAMALTDYNLCGALEFTRLAHSAGVQPIIGGEIILTDNSHIVLVAKTSKGYSNISRLFNLANRGNSQTPRLDPKYLPLHTEGVLILTGCNRGQIPTLISKGRSEEARKTLRNYMDWFGSDSVYVELNRNFMHGDSQRNRELFRIARDMGVSVVATNNVHYHHPERHMLQNVLVAAKNNTSLDNIAHLLKTSGEFYMKSTAQMERLFRSCPEAISNTLRIAENCSFDLSSHLNYQLPSPDVPDGYTPISYLRQLCYEAAQRRYPTMNNKVIARIQEELRLIEKHNMAGFMLLYREIVLLAQNIMAEIGMSNPEEPLEWLLPGRGRGSSVAMLTGYLIGISHVDPLVYNLTLERFLPEDLHTLPDIDLDFPRALRGQLIERIHNHFGSEFAVLTGMIKTYRMKGIIADIGQGLGLPKEDLHSLSKKVRSHDPTKLREEMLSIAKFRHRVDAPDWRNLINLAAQLMDAPKGLGQHVGGMILSSSPIPDIVPSRNSSIPGRYIMDWDKDSVANAGFAKIDILSLPILDQLHDIITLIEKNTGKRIDLTRINPADPKVYDMINQGKSKGVFLLQSPAQLKMGQRLMSRTLKDLVYQVALIRPGVGGQRNAVSEFVRRYRHGSSWGYDHPLEQRALSRSCGIIIWQEQVVQLISDMSGISSAEADDMRRTFASRNNQHLIARCWDRFRKGASDNGVDVATAQKIFSKINGKYMFPESHSYAFAISAYQAAYLKCHYPVEFFVTLMNNQPMGFYPLETLKQDARRFAVPFRNPCINSSEVRCTIEGDSVLIGLEFVKDVGHESSRTIVKERIDFGPYRSVDDFVQRVNLKPRCVESLVMAGAFDRITQNRRLALWKSRLYPRPTNDQRYLPLYVDDNIPILKDFTQYQKMLGEYRTMSIYPSGHIMEFVRPSLAKHVVTTEEACGLDDRAKVVVAGWTISRQHPRGETNIAFVTIEDETSDIQLAIRPNILQRYRHQLNKFLLLAHGEISRWDGTTSIVVSELHPIPADAHIPLLHDWN